MLASLLISTLRHLLHQAEWAQARLRPHAGLIAEIKLPIASLKLYVEPDGDLTQYFGEGQPDLVLTVPTEAGLTLLSGSDAAMKHVRIAGNAEFGEVLGFVLRNLEWDAEADMARIGGGILARRLHMTGARTLAWQRDALLRTTDNLREFLVLEQPTLVACPDLDQLSTDLINFADDLARIEKRMAKLDGGSVKKRA